MKWNDAQKYAAKLRRMTTEELKAEVPRALEDFELDELGPWKMELLLAEVKARKTAGTL